jgi:Matrixin
MIIDNRCHLEITLNKPPPFRIFIKSIHLRIPTIHKERLAFFAIAFFTGIIITSSLSLSLLSLVNYTLSSRQGNSVPSSMLLQSADGQEGDEEETGDEDEKDADENDEETNNNEVENEDEDEDSIQANSLEVCCSWDERLADGVLTYKIIREEESNENEAEDKDNDEDNDEDEDEREAEDQNIGDVSVELEKAVKEAVGEWNSKFLNLKLNEISSSENDDADIEVQFVEGLAGMVAGATMLRQDGDGLINEATIILPKAAFFVEYESEVFGVQYSSDKLKEIAIHEMGHALGLGHANFDADIMSQRLSSDEILNISKCDINGKLQANYWKLINNDTNPDDPNVSHVNC